MAVYRGTYTYEFGDKNGDVATMRVKNFVNDATTLGDVATASTTLGTAIGAPGVTSNAKVIRRGFQLLIDEAQLSAGSPPLDAEFPSVVDKAVLGFASAAGFSGRVSLPAPIEAIFHAPPSDSSVNPAYAAMATLISAIEDLFQGAPDTLLNLYTGGTRVGSRSRRSRSRSV